MLSGRLGSSNFTSLFFVAVHLFTKVSQEWDMETLPFKFSSVASHPSFFFFVSVLLITWRDAI